MGVINKKQYGFLGMNQDISKSKRNPSLYYEANNIRITPTEEDSLGSATLQRGNETVITLDESQTIIHANSINNYMVLFSSDFSGDDNIWRVDLADYTVTNIFKNNLGFTENTCIDSECYYENENIIKIYWVDGVNQLRLLNIINPVSSEYPELLDMLPAYNISQPKLESTGFGGTHTAGRIQYSYVLVKKNGQSTTHSPFSQLISLSKADGGGDVNEIVNQVNNIIIEGVDTKFDIIRLYSIKYTSLNQLPTVNLIAEEYITSDVFRYSDKGSFIRNSSLEQLLFAGGSLIVPKTISSRKNTLLLGNLQEKYFNINQDMDIEDVNYYDTRAFRFPKNQNWTRIKNKNGDYETVNYAGTSGLLLDGNKVPKTHDCINDLYDTSVTSYKTAGSRIGQYVAENVYNDEDPSKLTYCFSGLPSEITNTDTYIKISILTSSTPMFSVTKTLTFSEEEYSNFTNSLLTKLNSYLFEDSSYRVIAYIEDGDLLFQVVSKNDSNTTHSINTFGTYINVYNKVDTSTEDELLYVYQRNSDDWGASGDNILLSIKYSEVPDKSFLLKSGEVYRFGIKFYNKYGQETPPNWICDLKMPEGGNLWDGANCLSLKVTLLRTEKLKAQGVVGWRMVRVQRTDEDKTILHQGIVSSSIFQIYDKDEIKNQQELTLSRSIDTTIYNPTGEADFKGNAVKMPTPFFRTKNDIIDFPIDKYGYVSSVPSEEDWTYAKLNKLSDNRILNSNTLYMSKMEGKRDARRIQPYSEIFSTNVGFSLSSLFDAGEYNKSITIQENKLLQFYTPELLLENKDFSGITSFRVVGNLNNTENKSWGKRYAVDTQLVDGECKKEDGLNLYDIDSNDGLDLTKENFWDVVDNVVKFIKTALNGQIERTEEPNRNFFNSNGLIGPGGNKTNYFEYQYNRIFNLLDRNASTDYSFLEEPLRVGTGERRIKYYNYTFNNDIKNIITDNNERDTKKIFDGLDEDDYSTAISSVNSVGALCYLFSTEDQQALENMPGFTGDALLVEFRRNVINQYGGNTYEDRANNTYIEIGDYNPINVRSSLILHAGDIFAGVFKFARILPNLSKIYNSAYTSICEIIEFPVETSVDLSNRTDISSKGWDFLFHPQENEFHKYNTVYSQESTATQSRGSVFYFEELKEVSNKIVATKKKNPGELIDSWTDILINEQLLLDGNHGQIIKLITHNNSCLAFQEKAIANLQIQPRIQQVTTDGIGLEVGTGQILYDYNYITTSSGSTNMYSIDSTPSAVYYVDLLNKTFNRLSENGINGISDSLGLHTFFNNNLDVDTLKYSKYLQVINDNKTNDVYIINKDNFVLAFNELSNSFTSKYDFKSYLTGLYCEKGFYSSDNSNKLWKHNDNSYGSFYGDTYDSYITFLFSPNDMHREVVFNNLTLNTEYIDSEGNDVFYDEDYIVPFKSIFVWNDYMETNEEDLVYPNNIARKFRTWNIFIPRDKTNIFNRMRGKFVFVKLKIDNNLDNTLVLHDVVLSYVDNNK